MREKISEILSNKALVTRIIILFIVGLVSIGGLAWYINTYLYGSKASESFVTSQVGSTSDTVEVLETFYINMVLTSENQKPISQADVYINVISEGGLVEYKTAASSFTSGKTGTNQTDYFNETLIESYQNNQLRLALSALRAEDLSNSVTLRIAFTAAQDGKVRFDLDRTKTQFVGPSGEATGASRGAASAPVEYALSTGGTTTTTVTIGRGGQSAPPAVITLAPPPSCSMLRAQRNYNLPEECNSVSLKKENGELSTYLKLIAYEK